MGKDKWESVIKMHEQLLHTREWRGQSSFTLEKVISQHRYAFVQMQAASGHVTYQLPNEHCHVNYLLTAIKCSDAGLQAAMASIKMDQTPDSDLSNNFEAAAAHLLPCNPVLKKRAERVGNKGDSVASAFGSKKGIEKTGVHLRYHEPEEYNALPKA